MDKEESLAIYHRLERMRQISTSLPDKLSGKEKEISLVQEYNSLYTSLSFYSGIELIQHFENFLLSSEEDYVEKVDSVFRSLETKFGSLFPYCSPSARYKLKDSLTVLGEKKKRILDSVGESEDALSKLFLLIEEEDKIFSPDDLIDYHHQMMVSYSAAKSGGSLKGLRERYADDLDSLKRDIQTLLEDICSPSTLNKLWPKFSL